MPGSTTKHTTKTPPDFVHAVEEAFGIDARNLVACLPESNVDAPDDVVLRAVHVMGHAGIDYDQDDPLLGVALTIVELGREINRRNIAPAIRGLAAKLKKVLAKSEDARVVLKRATAEQERCAMALGSRFRGSPQTLRRFLKAVDELEAAISDLAATEPLPSPGRARLDALFSAESILKSWGFRDEEIADLLVVDGNLSLEKRAKRVGYRRRTRRARAK